MDQNPKHGNAIKHIWAEIDRKFLSPKSAPDNVVDYWRERIFQILLFFMVIVGGVTNIPCLYYLILTDKMWLAATDIIIALVMISVFLFRGLGFSNRVLITCVMAFFLGVAVLASQGPYSNGLTWLFIFPLFTGILINHKMGVIALAINAATLGFFSWWIFTGRPDWAWMIENEPDRWLFICINFLLLNIVATISATNLLAAIEKTTRRLQGTIIDNVRANEALQDSEQKYRRIYEHMKIGVAQVTLDSIILNANEAFCQMLGYSEDELIGKHLKETTAPDSVEASMYNQKRLAKGEIDHYHMEKKYTHKQGHTVYGLLDANLILDSEGNPAYCLGSVVDVTERIRLEAQLQQAQKLKAVGTLAGGIAHDFNNLLQAIAGYTQIMLLNAQESDPNYVRLEAIQSAGERAAALIRQLLLFSRKAEPEKKPVELNREIERARLILERTIPKMIDIDVHLQSDLWPINADPVQMEQILLNLGKNAADAMPDGGRLVIETENAVLDREYVRNHLGAEAGKNVLLTVTDTGQGMDEKVVEHIFEPFYTTKDIGKGTGLGLASVYGIVKSHGGYITCQSEVDKGTAFEIYLPALDTEEDRPQKDMPKATPEGGTETLILVDDDDFVRDFASKILQHYGYTVLTASNGEEALEMYADGKNEIDLVILDIGMPGIGGNKCLEELLKIDTTVKVIIASGYLISGQAQKILESGAAGYVAKPYHHTELAGMVRAVLDE